MGSMQQVYKHMPTGTHYVPVKGRSMREVPGFGPDETVVQRHVYPLSGDRSVWLPEAELEMVPDLRGRRFPTRRIVSFWTSVGAVLVLGFPVQWYLTHHGITPWLAVPVAVLAANNAVEMVLRALRRR